MFKDFGVTVLLFTLRFPTKISFGDGNFQTKKANTNSVCSIKNTLRWFQVVEL